MSGHAGEEAEFDDAGLPGVAGFEVAESVVEGEEVAGTGFEGGEEGVEWMARGVGASAGGGAPAGMVHQDAAHGCCGEGEEACAVGEVESA